MHKNKIILNEEAHEKEKKIKENHLIRNLIRMLNMGDTEPDSKK
jgi:hypothetical protein